MNTKLVYDLPTRLFHWLFAVIFIVAFIIAENTDDDSLAFSYHMLLGFLLVFLVLFRFIWGLIGTKHARFSDFSLKPTAVVQYFQEILNGSTAKWTGHNPASSWAAISMFILTATLGVTGYLMASGNGSHSLKELHEFLANAFLVFAILHVIGVAIHSLRHRDAIWLSMVTGKKSGVEAELHPVGSHLAAGLTLTALTAGFALYLNTKFDQGNRELLLFGTRLQLAESEEEEHQNGKSSESAEIDHYQEKEDED